MKFFHGPKLVNSTIIKSILDIAKLYSNNISFIALRTLVER